MKLLTLQNDGTLSLGVQTDDGIIDIKQVKSLFPPASPVADTVDEVIAGGELALQALSQYIASLQGKMITYLQPGEITWGPCVTNPQKIICIGLNYRKHAEETNAPIPKTPIIFSKFNNTLAGHRSDIRIPEETEKLDYEAELAIVIGKEARNVPRQSALDYVFGYAAANDLSARDLQLRTNQWLLGKTCDGFCPLGPYLVTADEVPDPNDLEIRCIVNGEQRQHSHTSDMIFHCDEIISYLSKHMTLLPGDVILTGTPEGVVLGYPEEQQQYLQPGDIVTVEIEKLGSLLNRMI